MASAFQQGTPRLSSLGKPRRSAGLRLRHTAARRLLSRLNSEWTKAAASSDLVLMDGTFWSDDELTKTGRSKKTAREIGHLPLSGADGLLEQFPKAARGRKVLLHINNTNPILDEASPEHRAVLDAGFEIAYDGMEFEL